MGMKVTNFSELALDECGIFLGSTGENVSPTSVVLQKSSINTIEGPCFSPFGAVSNIDCPDYDPTCNCYISQYRPKEPPPSKQELMKLKQGMTECGKITEILSKSITEYDQGEDGETVETTTVTNLWFGVDFSNPRCPYNCFSPGLTLLYDTKYQQSKPIKYYGLTGASYGSGLTFNYALAYKGNTGPVLNTTTVKGQPITSNDFWWYDKTDGDRNSYTSVLPKISDSPEYFNSINGPLFPFYLEYSKTNATFWNTPDKTPLLRNAYISLYAFQKIKIVVNGSILLSVGDLINILMPIRDELADSSQLTNKRFAGTWMIYRIERTITGGKHTMSLYLMRDGFNTNKYSEPNLDKKGKPIVKGSGGGPGNMGMGE